MNNYKDKRVLYVTSNKAVAFQIINSGVIESLKHVVSKVHVCNAREQKVLKVALEMKPDLVIFISGNVITIEDLIRLRKNGIPTAVWYTDNPYNTDFIAKTAPYFDFVFTTEIACLSFFSLIGCRQVHLLPLAANTNVFYPNSPRSRKTIDICFIGTAWSSRIELIDSIASFLSTKNVFIAGPGWNQLKNYGKLSTKIQNEALTMEMTRDYISKSKIVINSHRKHDEKKEIFNSREIYAHSVNPKVFEISACGAFQLTDVRADLGRFYKLGSEVETYSSARELIQKVNHFLLHEAKRSAIASKGLMRTLNDHTYSQRINYILSKIFGSEQ